MRNTYQRISIHIIHSHFIHLYLHISFGNVFRLPTKSLLLFWRLKLTDHICANDYWWQHDENSFWNTHILCSSDIVRRSLVCLKCNIADLWSFTVICGTQIGLNNVYDATSDGPAPKWSWEFALRDRRYHQFKHLFICI